MQTQHLTCCVFQMQGSQAEMDVALFNWCWVLKFEAELQTDNVVDEANLENMVDNIHDRRLEVCELSFKTFRVLFMKQMLEFKTLFGNITVLQHIQYRGGKKIET